VQLNSIGNVPIHLSNPENYGFETNIGYFELILQVIHFAHPPSGVLEAKIVSGMLQFIPVSPKTKDWTLLFVVLIIFTCHPFSNQLPGVLGVQSNSIEMSQFDPTSSKTMDLTPMFTIFKNSYMPIPFCPHPQRY
jgi:hypothetical protein